MLDQCAAGLGKTFQALMLVAGHPAAAVPSWCDDPEAMGYHEKNPCKIKTTLVVAPATLLAQWQKEADRHCQLGALTAAAFVGARLHAPSFEYSCFNWLSGSVSMSYGILGGTSQMQS